MTVITDATPIGDILMKAIQNLFQRIVVNSFAMALLIGIAIPSALADADLPKSKDHPLLTRFPDSRITEYQKAFNAVEFKVSSAKDGKLGAGAKIEKKMIEGDATIIHYFHNIAGKQPSALQLLRSYQNAIKSIGGEVVYDRIWVRVEPGIFSAPTQSYKIWIVEVAAMKQVVSANKLLDEINKNGFIALYINFDIGKHDLKTDGVATVKKIVAMLKSAPSLQHPALKAAPTASVGANQQTAVR
ncbi:MAG: hypothetical protein IPH40_06325 [Polaromonas sp.]|nr:hypothetical protein [Polaromonas sp.]